MAVYVFCENTRLLIILQPLKATLVGQVLNLEMLEFSLKAVTIGAGSHHTGIPASCQVCHPYCWPGVGWWQLWRGKAAAQLL